MSLIFSVSIGLTVGIIISFMIGSVRNYPKKQTKELPPNFLKQMKEINRYIFFATFLVLGIGLIWTIYFLILGLIDPSQTEYATNVSQLIVSVLTVFSIIIAFYQFLNDRDKH